MKTNDLVRTAKRALLSQSVSIQNYTLEDCQIAYHATTNSLMQTIRFVHIFFCFVGIVAASLFIFVLLSRSSTNLHVNLRLSLASLSFAACIACTQLLFIAVYSLIHTLSENNPCNALYEARWCAIARFPVVLSIYSTLCGILVLAVERTIATLKFKTYEVHGSRLVACILIATQWTISTLFAVVSVLMRSDSGYVHYCTVYVSHPRTARRQVNEFVNNAMHTLTERYQLQENVRIMRILIPSITVHAVLGLVGLISLLVFAIAQSRALPWLFNERAPLPYEDRPILTNHSVIASRPSRQMERDSDTHFDMLQEMWKK
uniref:G_PROTEIN_RECEP_F1_2 domain-containing protein n=1 Tax=Heterorhabditis bacteriophora TaxID=37862 RepID=A0A1I7XB69_HETBA